MGNWGLIDVDTPTSAYIRPAWNSDSEMELVFSDEFNTDGRTFYPGDDPYWEGVDLHYWVSAYSNTVLNLFSQQGARTNSRLQIT
jgi:beta-glucanase (GH16 family)